MTTNQETEQTELQKAEAEISDLRWRHHKALMTLQIARDEVRKLADYISAADKQRGKLLRAELRKASR